MLINPGHEIFVFVSAFLCGQIICIIFDIFRAIRKNINPSVYTVNLHDIVFCSIAFLLVYHTFSLTNDGAVRWYEFASLFIACSVYFLFESRYVLKLFTVIISWLIKPIKWFCLKICRAIKALKTRIVKPIYVFLCRFSKKYIKKPWKTTKNQA